LNFLAHRGNVQRSSPSRPLRQGFLGALITVPSAMNDGPPDKTQSPGRGSPHQGKVRSRGSGGRIRYIRITEESKESKA
jgi:hypothetical protein